MANTLLEHLDTSGSSHTPPAPHTRLELPDSQEGAMLQCLLDTQPDKSTALSIMYVHIYCVYTCIHVRDIHV